MIDIRPVSDLKNNLAEIENTVQSGKPVYLTENGYGTMVVLSLEHYSALMGYSDFSVQDEEAILDECERRAEICSKRYSHKEMYEKLRRSLNDE